MTEALYDLVEKICLITRSGKIVNLLDFDPALIDDRDIAYALSHINRWTGHAPAANVAFHTSIVVRQVELAWNAVQPNDVTREALILAAWLHDAPETYVNDCVRPLKKHLGEAYSGIEGPIHDRIFVHYGLEPAVGHHPLIKLADTQAGRIEALSFAMGAGADPDEDDMDPGLGGKCFPVEMRRETIAAALEAPWGFHPKRDLFPSIPHVVTCRRNYLEGLRRAHENHVLAQLGAAGAYMTKDDLAERLAAEGLISAVSISDDTV